MRFLRPYPLLLFLSLVASACKHSVTSEEQSLSLSANLTFEDWVKACKADLSKPQEGESNRKDLVALTGTDDCAKAYPQIKAIFHDSTLSSLNSR